MFGLQILKFKDMKKSVDDDSGTVDETKTSNMTTTTTTTTSNTGGNSNTIEWYMNRVKELESEVENLEAEVERLKKVIDLRPTEVPHVTCHVEMQFNRRQILFYIAFIGCGQISGMVMVETNQKQRTSLCTSRCKLHGLLK